MPKMKTHKGAAKRFKKTGSGKFRMYHSHTSHILETKSPKRKRNLRKPTIAADSDSARISRMLPYA